MHGDSWRVEQIDCDKGESQLTRNRFSKSIDNRIADDHNDTGFTSHDALTTLMIGGTQHYRSVLGVLEYVCGKNSTTQKQRFQTSFGRTTYELV